MAIKTNSVVIITTDEDESSTIRLFKTIEINIYFSIKILTSFISTK